MLKKGAYNLIQRAGILLMLVIMCALTSCSNEEVKAEVFQELTSEQQAAFEALDSLQVNSDDWSRLYSTFPDLHHKSFPADTSIIISQAEFLIAMREFVTLHYTKMPSEKRSRLIYKAVKAKGEYKVLHCRGYGVDVDYSSGIPRQGTWIFPKILGHRDLVLVW